MKTASISQNSRTTLFPAVLRQMANLFSGTPRFNAVLTEENADFEEAVVVSRFSGFKDHHLHLLYVMLVLARVSAAKRILLGCKNPEVLFETDSGIEQIESPPNYQEFIGFVERLKVLGKPIYAMGEYRIDQWRIYSVNDQIQLCSEGSLAKQVQTGFDPNVELVVQSLINWRGTDNGNCSSMDELITWLQCDISSRCKMSSIEILPPNSDQIKSALYELHHSGRLHFSTKLIGPK
jgi:hypothetical protein